MLKVLITTFGGLIMAAAGFFLFYYYITGINEHRSIIILLPALALVVAGIFFLIRGAHAFDALILMRCSLKFCIISVSDLIDLADSTKIKCFLATCCVHCSVQ